MDLVLIWTYRRHSLYVDQCDSVDDAIGRAWGTADAGSGALAFIEVWGPAGHRIIHTDQAMRHRRWKALDAEQRRAITEPSEWVAAVEVLAPGGESARLEWFTSTDAAEAEADRLRPALGDRVVVKQLSRA